MPACGRPTGAGPDGPEAHSQGASLNWVERTSGFTVNVHEYDELRDRAYDDLARGLQSDLGRAGLLILDAVYGTRTRCPNASIQSIVRASDANQSG
jgi:hypothetical protein